MLEQNTEAQLRSQVEAEIDANGGPEKYFSNLHLKLSDREELIEDEIPSSVNSRRAHNFGLIDTPRYPPDEPIPPYASKLHAGETAREYYWTIGQIVDKLGIGKALVANVGNDLERQQIARPLYVEMRLRGYTHHDIVG